MPAEGSRKEIVPGVTSDEKGEIYHDGPLAILQNYENYTEEMHQIWHELYLQQTENLSDIAYEPWLNSMETIGLNSKQIPHLSNIGHQLRQLTGWTPVPISGFLSAEDYFSYLAKRQFPTVTHLRTREEFEFMVEPDLFHDAYGHLPMHADTHFANFLQLYGEAALQAKTDKHKQEMQRLYWFTVEYCLIDVGGSLKVCGSGHMSGIKESRYSLTDAVKKHPFDLDMVCKQDYNPHVLQPVMFVIDSYEQLYESMQKKAEEFKAN